MAEPGPNVGDFPRPFPALIPEWPAEPVYNPYGLLKLFHSREFEDHWFETATPRFLVETLIRRGFTAPDLESVHADSALLSSFDVDHIAPEALLFQTGYLTVVEVAERAEPGAALAQLKERRYADKHRTPGRAVHLIGVEISAERREIVAFDVERA